MKKIILGLTFLVSISALASDELLLDATCRVICGHKMFDTVAGLKNKKLSYISFIGKTRTQIESFSCIDVDADRVVKAVQKCEFFKH